MLKHLLVAAIVLWVNPWLVVALARHAMHHALHVARREPINPRTLFHVAVLFTQSRRALCDALLAHVVQQPAHIFSCEVGTQCPRCIDVAKCGSQVWNIRIGEALVRPSFSEVHLTAIDKEIHFTERHEFEPGCRNDDVGINVFTRGKLNASFRNLCDVIGNNRSFTFAH